MRFTLFVCLFIMSLSTKVAEVTSSVFIYRQFHEVYCSIILINTVLKLY